MPFLFSSFFPRYLNSEEVKEKRGEDCRKKIPNIFNEEEKKARKFDVKQQPTFGEVLLLAGAAFLLRRLCGFAHIHTVVAPPLCGELVKRNLLCW